MKKILLIDDHRLVRAGLKALIESSDGFEVVGEGSDGSEMAELVDRYHPDIVISDLSMKNVSGIDAIRNIKETHPDLPVIALSMHESTEVVMKVLKAGAEGYLVKDSAENELDMALDAVLAGQQYLSPRVSKLVLKAMMQPEQNNSNKASLTPRQNEILRMISLGYAAKEIAYELGISVKTVEAHRAQIMDRLEIRDVPGLVRYAIRNNLIGVDESK